jgi:HK97 family phage portal protein
MTIGARFRDALSVLFARGSAENPANPLTWGNLGPGDSPNPLTIGAVYRAVDLISSAVGKLPLCVFARTPTGREKSVDDPAYNLLRYRPNTNMGAMTFRRTLQAQALLQGGGFAWIERETRGAGAGRPVALYPLDPTATYPVRENGDLKYVTTIGGTLHRFDPSSVLHIRGLGGDGLTGYSVIRQAAESFGIASESTRYVNLFFKNAARPSVTLEVPAKLTDEQVRQWHVEWEKMTSGKNLHGMAVLSGGAKATPFSVSAQDAQLVETMKWSLTDIANWFGVPPHKVGDSTRAGYKGLEEENMSYLSDTLDPWLVTWEEECREKLLSEDAKAQDSKYVEFSREALLRTNLTARGIYYRTALAGHPWMTVNEVRQRENMNNAEGGDFDEIVPPTNNFGEPAEPAGTVDPADTETDPEDAPPTGNARAIAAAREALGDAVRRMEKRLRVHWGKAKTEADREAYRDTWEDLHGGVIRDALRPTATVVEALTGEAGLVESTLTAIRTEVES